jgi:hypothetical protein
MAKVGIVLLADVETQGDKGRAFNALTTAREFKEAGDEVVLLFEGAGTKWVRELAGDDGFSWTEVGRKRIKGLKQPIPVWRCRPAQ